MGQGWTHLQRSHQITQQSLGNASSLSSLCGGSLSGEVPQPHPSPHGHSQRVDSQGRKGKSSLVARDRGKLERSDENGSEECGRSKRVGSNQGCPEPRGKQGGRLGCTAPPLHPLSAGRSKSWREIHGQENSSLTESGAQLNWSGWHQNVKLRTGAEP